VYASNFHEISFSCHRWKIYAHQSPHEKSTFSPQDLFSTEIACLWISTSCTPNNNTDSAEEIMLMSLVWQGETAA